MGEPEAKKRPEPPAKRPKRPGLPSLGPRPPPFPPPPPVPERSGASSGNDFSHFLSCVVVDGLGSLLSLDCVVID